MNFYQRSDSCFYNPIHVKFNEEFTIGDTFSYTLQYPSFSSLKNTYFNINQNVLNNINSTISTDVLTFKNGLVEEEKQVNADNLQNNLPQVKYNVVTDYSVTFNKNHLLSVINTLTGDSGGVQPTYRTLYNYNYDLLTGNEIALKNIFNDGVDYIKVITDYIKYKINQDKDL